MASTGPAGSAVKALQLELKKIQAEPVEGFRVKLVNDENIFEWEVAIFGPPGTLYEGGYFKVSLCSLETWQCHNTGEPKTTFLTTKNMILITLMSWSFPAA